MMGVLAVIWGILSLIGMVIGFLPCLGWLNWLNIPFALVGLVISLIAATRVPSRGAGTAGAVMCGIAMAVGVMRLILGGGWL